MLPSIDNLIKGRIADVLAETLLRDLGFFVLPFGELGLFVLNFGKEHSAAPITDIQSFVKACGGDFKFRKKSDEVNTASKMLHRSPDLIAVHSSGRTELIDVKYRANGQLIKDSKRTFATYPNSVILVINSEVAQDILESKTSADTQLVESLRNTRFHIWRHDGPKVGTTSKGTSPIPLSQWLIEEFKCDKAQVERLVKEYESYVTRWFSKAVK